MSNVTPTKTFVLKGFPGGLNSEYVEHLRNPSEAETTNFAFATGGEAFVRQGLHLLAAHDSWTGGAGAAKRLGPLFSFTPNASANKYLITVDLDGKVWRTGDGPASPLVACNIATPAQINLGVPTIVPDAAILGDFIVLVSEDNHAYNWDGTTGNTWEEITDHTLDDSGTSTTWEFPICSTVCSHLGRMWAAGNDTYPSRLFWSGAIGTLKTGTEVAAGPWNWPATNWVEINPEDGGEITKIVPFGQAVIVFKTNSTYAFVGVGDPDNARLYPIHMSVGCTLPGTAAAGTGRLFWASSDGVYVYDGSGVTRVDGKVRSALQTLTAGTYAKYASAFCLGERYHLMIPGTSLTTNAVAHYVFDSEHNRWEYHDDGGFGAALVFDDPYTTRWGGVMALASHDGYDDTYTAAGVAGTTTVAAGLKTSWLPPPDAREGMEYRVRRIDLYLDRPSVSGSMACSYVVRLWTNYNETTRSIGYTINMDTVQTVAQPFLIQLPGWSGLCTAFRVSVDAVAPGTDTGTERIAVNGVGFLLSERPAKRSRMLASGVTKEA
jgi:hypothetical protein